MRYGYGDILSIIVWMEGYGVRRGPIRIEVEVAEYGSVVEIPLISPNAIVGIPPNECVPRIFLIQGFLYETPVGYDLCKSGMIRDVGMEGYDVRAGYPFRPELHIMRYLGVVDIPLHV